MFAALRGGFAGRAQGLAEQVKRGANQAQGFARQAQSIQNSYVPYNNNRRNRCRCNNRKMNSGVQGTGYMGRNGNRVLAQGVVGTGYPQPPKPNVGRNRNRNNVLARGVQGTGYPQPPVNNRTKRFMEQLPTRNVMLNRAGGTVFGRDPLGGGGLLNTGGLGGGGGLLSWFTG